MAKVKVAKKTTNREEVKEIKKEEVSAEAKKPEAETKPEAEKKPSWLRRNGKMIVGAATTVAGIAATLFFGKKLKDYNDEWNAGQKELQERFPDGEVTMTDPEGNELKMSRMATYGGKHGPSEFLFWSEVPEEETEAND